MPLFTLFFGAVFLSLIWSVSFLLALIVWRWRRAAMISSFTVVAGALGGSAALLGLELLPYDPDRAQGIWMFAGLAMVLGGGAIPALATALVVIRRFWPDRRWNTRRATADVFR